MKYGKYILFVYNKEGKKVAFFTADSEEVVIDMACQSSYSDPDKYDQEMTEPEVIGKSYI